MKRVFGIGLLTVILILGSMAGCGGDGGATEEKTGGTTGTTDSDVYTIKVYLDDSLKDTLILNDLLSLEQVTLSTPEQDSDQEGPYLLDVLKLAGINDFNEVRVVGTTQGRVATAEITLQSSQVDDTVVLDITNRGTTKLTGLNIPSNDWIRDVSELWVK